MSEKDANQTSIRYKLIVAFLMQSSFLGIFICYSTRKILNSELLTRGLPAEMVSEILFQFTTVITGLTFLGIILALLISFLFSNSISRGLKKLMEGLQEIKKRNLKHVIKVESNDEIGELAESFNMMAKELNEREDALNKSAEDLRNANVELTAHREHLEELVATQTKELKEQNLLLENRMNAYSHLVEDMKLKLDSVGDPIRIIDKDYCVSYANKSFLEMCGAVKEEDVIGKKCYEVFPGENCDTENCPLKLVMNGAEKVDYDVRKKLPDGNERFYMLNVRPYYSEEREVIGIMEIFKDITVRREMQDLAESSAQQQGRMEMANNVLHDIGNALTGISVHALKPQNQKDWDEIKSLRQLKNLFVKKNADLASAFGREKSEELFRFIDALAAALEKRCASSVEFSKKIARAVGHMTSVLDLQRLYMKESGAPLATDIPIRNMIDDALLMLAAGAEKRNIEVKTSFDGQNPYVQGDQTRLIRVFLNVIKNAYEAFDAIDSNTSNVFQVNVYADNEKDQAVIVFADNASGFHPERAENFFTRGFSTKEKGLGIGLHECRSIIESHGGTIAIESEGEGKGAKVVIKLPLLKTRKG